MLTRHNTLSTRTSFIIQGAGKLESVQKFKMKLLASSCFIADESLVKIVWLHVAVFSQVKVYSLHFRYNVHL